ncbi:MAG: hypothetical protein K2N46_10625, partial [Lachnospiraceae bacterium]|nr:hypothetical protein [Lachnospiraceae bacterium]
QFVHIYACFYSTTHPAKTQAKFQNVFTCHYDSAVRPNSNEKIRRTTEKDSLQIIYLQGVHAE